MTGGAHCQRQVAFFGYLKLLYLHRIALAEQGESVLGSVRPSALSRLELLSTLCRRQCRDNREFSTVEMLSLLCRQKTVGLIMYPYCRDSRDCRDLRGPTVDRQVSVATTPLLTSAQI